MDSTKVFIDTDNEITFILEKILSAKSDKVSLVIPDRASIFSSITGLKLIRRVIDKSDKLLVLVTLDEQGAELARNAGLAVVSRVGEISEAVWEKALKEKFEIKKRDVRVHYMPEAIASEDRENGHDLKSGSSMDILNMSNVAKDLEVGKKVVAETRESDGIEEGEHSTREDTILDVPQIRINIDQTELEIAEKAEPEDQETVPEIQEPPMPSFLSREVPEKAVLKPFEALTREEELDSEEHVEDILPTGHNDTLRKERMTHEDHEDTRRRRISTSRANISNLSFTIGKDIEDEKKK